MAKTLIPLGGAIMSLIVPSKKHNYVIMTPYLFVASLKLAGNAHWNATCLKVNKKANENDDEKERQWHHS